MASLRSVLELPDGQHSDLRTLRRIRVFAILAKGVSLCTIGGYAHSCARGAVAPLSAERSEAMVSQRVLKLVSKRTPSRDVGISRVAYPLDQPFPAPITSKPVAIQTFHHFISTFDVDFP